MKLKFKKLHKDAVIPSFANPNDKALCKSLYLKGFDIVEHDLISVAVESYAMEDDR